MGKLDKGLSYLIALNIEAAIIILAAWVVAEWANSNYPQSFSWASVAIPLAILIIVRQWYVVIRKLIKSNNDNAQNLNKKG